MMSSLIALAAAQAASQPPPVKPVPVPPPVIREISPPPILVPPAPPPVMVPAPPPAPSARATRPQFVSGSIVSDDYPAAAIRAGHEGTTQARFTVGPNGRVIDCDVAQSSGSAFLDNATCQLIIRRFRFRPAALDGVPVASTVLRRVTWRLPREPLIQFAQGRFTWSVTASPAATTACDLDLDGGAFRQFDEDNCSVPADAWLVDREELAPGHPPVRVTQVLSLLPQGEALTLPSLPGTPFWEEVAEIEIALDGSVTACTLVSQRGEVPAYIRSDYQPLCGPLAAGRHFAPAPPDAAPRRARMQSALYVEVLQPERR